MRKLEHTILDGKSLPVSGLLWEPPGKFIQAGPISKKILT